MQVYEESRKKNVCHELAANVKSLDKETFSRGTLMWSGKENFIYESSLQKILGILQKDIAKIEKNFEFVTSIAIYWQSYKLGSVRRISLLNCSQMFTF